MVRNVPIVMNGVTGRMGTRQHLVRSVLAIREQGGVALPGGEVAVPEPILVGRNEKKLRSLRRLTASSVGVWTWKKVSLTPRSRSTSTPRPRPAGPGPSGLP